jgi:hypothetical protein
MSVRKALILGLLGMAATSAPAQDTAIPSSDDVDAILGEASVEPAPEMKALIDTCTAHKFETIVVVDGSRKGSRVKICGEEGQSDADWLNTLRDSLRKTADDPSMAASLKDQIVTALVAEIARLEGAAASPAAAAVLAPGPASAARLVGMSEEIVAPAGPEPQYSLVPPLPAPLPRAGTAAAKANAALASVAAAPLIRPRLTVRCALPREAFAGCGSMARETLLMIRADEDIAPRTSLRFLRGGEARAELELGTLRKGESMREKLPGRICSGVLRGKVQIQVLNAGKVAETLGPYALYCGS